MSPANKTRLHALGRVVGRSAVSLLLLAIALWLCGWRSILDRVAELPLNFIVIAWIYYALCQWLSAVRWKLLLRAKGADTPIGRLFILYMVGMFANSFLPTGLGGDAIKIYNLHRWGRDTAVSAASVLLERFAGMLALAALGAVAAIWLLIQGQSMIVALICLMFSAGLWTAGGFVFSPHMMRLLRWMMGTPERHTLRGRIMTVVETVQSYRNAPAAILQAFAISLVLQAAIAIYYSATGLALGEWINPIYFLLFFPPVTFLTLLPISLGGLGLRELVLLYLFASIGIQKDSVLTISLTAHVLNLALGLIAGSLSLLANSRLSRPAPSGF